jgi:hypothetical protein
LADRGIRWRAAASFARRKEIESPDSQSGPPGTTTVINKILIGFSIVCNFATLLGLWIAYAASPATLQHRVGSILILCGAITSILGYLAFAWFVMRGKIDREASRGASFSDDDPRYATVRNHTFRNETVELDGKRFEDCEFENSTILFHGRAPTEIIDPTFKGSLQIASDDPAINNFIGLSELLRRFPHVAKFDCVVIDDHGHKKQQLSSWTRVKFTTLADKSTASLAANRPKIVPVRFGRSADNRYGLFVRNDGEPALDLRLDEPVPIGTAKLMFWNRTFAGLSKEQGELFIDSEIELAGGSSLLGGLREQMVHANLESLPLKIHYRDLDNRNWATSFNVIREFWDHGLRIGEVKQEKT